MAGYNPPAHALRRAIRTDCQGQVLSYWPVAPILVKPWVMLE
jgi:hypothetical protein